MAPPTNANLTLVQDSDTRARPTFERWVCIGCGHAWTAKLPAPKYCRECGLSGGYAPEAITLRGTQSQDLDRLEPGIVVPEWSALLPIGLPLGLTMVMRGRPGGGKSRAAFRLASQMGVAAIFGLEMGKSLSMETATLAGAQLDSLWWYDDVEGLDDLEILSPAVVVVDSVQKVRARRSVVTRLRRWARENSRNVIFVSQLGHHGASRHGEDDDFDTDVVVDVSPGMVDGVACRRAHALNEKASKCKPGCAHVRIAKSRVCPLINGDVPIVAGF